MLYFQGPYEDPSKGTLRAFQSLRWTSLLEPRHFKGSFKEDIGPYKHIHVYRISISPLKEPLEFAAIEVVDFVGCRVSYHVPGCTSRP